ncbi:hypothetical protein A2U01_0057171, partial [Trifolium medium]|nr:hypothetical protein [Trifolium medium]
MSTLYLSMKYPLDDGRVGMVRGDQALARQCYESSLRIKSSQTVGEQLHVAKTGTNEVNTVESTDLDPREEFQDRRVIPIEELESIQIGEAAHQTTSLGTNLSVEEKEKIISILENNVDLFAWKPSDMSGI